MKRLSFLFLVPLLLIAASAPAPRPKDTGPTPSKPKATATAPSKPAMNAEHYLSLFIDPGVDPRQDFFHYAVGKWLRENPIPANERWWGIGHVVQEETYHRLVGINQGASKSRAAAGTNAQKIGDFWFAAMDSATNARQGFAPLKEEFARIEAIQSKDSLLAEIPRLKYMGVDALCGVGISQDEKRSDRYAVHLYQGGLGLPNRDYYFDTDDRAKMLRLEYVKHVAKMFQLLGDDSTRAGANAQTVMAVETELAGASRKLEALRDPIANYNPMSVSAVSTLTPTVRWKEFLDRQQIHAVDTVVVGQAEFFEQMD